MTSLNYSTLTEVNENINQTIRGYVPLTANTNHTLPFTLPHEFERLCCSETGGVVLVISDLLGDTKSSKFLFCVQCRIIELE